MSNNYYDDDDELSRPKKKSSPFFLFAFIGIFIIALASAAYYVFLSPDFNFINEPVAKRPSSATNATQVNANNSSQTQDTPNLNLTNTKNTTTNEDIGQEAENATHQSAELTDENAEKENPEKTSGEKEAIHTTDTPTAQADSQDPAFPFDDYSLDNPSTPQDVPPSAQSNTKSTDENSLAVHNMNTPPSQKQAQSTNQASQTNPNTAQIRANTAESNASNNTFELAPPSNHTNNFHIASEEELAQKRQATEQSQLEQLQRAKAEQVELTREQKAELPASEMIALSETSISQLPNNDPTITQLFLHSMAQMLVNNYDKIQNNVPTNTISASKLSQYFGTTLRGLTHPKGRAGIFEYAYKPQMITKIADYMTPRLLAEMNIVAKQKGLSKEEEAKMYHTYANHVADTANILNAVTKTQNIKALINQTLEKEKLLLLKKQDFAEQQIAFENAKLERKNTEQIERNMQNIAKEAAVIEQEYLTSKRLVVGAVFKDFPETQKVSMNAQTRQEEIYELALWAYRRNNTSANNAAIAALSKFANTLKNQ